MGMVKTPTNNYMNKLLTVREIADMLNISLATAYRLINVEEINFYKIGNSVRIREDDIIKLLKKSRVDSIK